MSSTPPFRDLILTLQQATPSKPNEVMARLITKIFLVAVLAGLLLNAFVALFLQRLGPFLQDCLLMNDVFVGAYDDKIEYDGRWTSSPDQFGRDAAFGGSSFQFSVFNTSSVNLRLANVHARSSDKKLEGIGESPLVLTPVKAKPSKEGPISFFYTINGSSNATYHHNILWFAPLSRQLDLNAVHTFRVTLPYSDNRNVFQFRGLTLSRGGQLLHPKMIDNGKQMITGSQNKGNSTGTYEKENVTSRRTLVEIMAPTPLLTHTCPHMNSSIETSTSWGVNWPSLLQNNFQSSTFSTVPISLNSSITSDDKTMLPQTIFFRSGPPNSSLYNHPWTFTSKTSTPGALILILGLADVEAFLSSPTSHSKHDFTTFIDAFSRRYSTFIQTLRRTIYSASSLADSRLQNPLINQNGHIDESHLYNSAPSTLPIFIVLPPIPSPLLVEYSRQLKSVLHHAATKTLNDLKWHIGDQKTIIIDTAGWLNDDDFTICPTGTSTNPTNNMTPEVAASDFTLTQSGHIKFAHHLSLHLCPYIGGGKEKCPFQKHGEYVGNLVVPGVDGVGRVLEQKRVGRIKEVFGVKKGRDEGSE